MNEGGTTAPDPMVSPPTALAGADPGDDFPSHGPRVTRWPLIVAFGVWTMFVWGNRLRNIWSDLLLSTDERVWLSVIAGSFLVLGLATAVIGFGLRRYAPTRGDVITVGILAGWTTGVWVARAIEIATDDAHSVGFIVVHVALGVISIALGAFAWKAMAAARPPVVDQAPL